MSDIVVVRDDNWASGTPQFQSLVEPLLPAGDGLAGFRVVRGVSIAPLGTLLGTQRIGSNLSIAVDPRNSRRVYIAWCDGLATTASPYTLRVRRSDDGGLNWTGDLFTAARAINPGLAVNNQGVVALLYQQLASVSGTNRWQTHLVRSTDRFVSVATNNTLADVLDSSAGATINVIIGDYANLIAVGKDFFGAFSAQNLPVNANFPSGITYLRNANFVTQQLLAVDNVTPVSTSVDPFFVHFQTVELKDDFYVRDWTDSPTSGDNGAEPSIKPDFYVTPDVWNRRGTLPGSFPNDQPEQEDAGNGTGNIGDNWLFARIRRRAAAPAGSADVTVRAHFLISKLGTGSNYIDATDVDPDVTITSGDPMVTFTAAEVGPKTTDALYWHLNAISSTHLCAAVEISTPSDPFVGLSLRGRAPGWPDQDLEIVDDNNKAQRNMGLTTTPARGVGSSLTASYAIAHNAATFPRDMVIQYRLSPTLRQRVKQIEIDVMGQQRIRARETGTIVLKGMQPGENRWIGTRFRPPAGKNSEVLAVFFDEMIEASAVNGFGLGVRLSNDQEVLIHTLNRYYSVLTRLAAGWELPNTDEQIGLVAKAIVTARKRHPLASTLARMKQVFQDRLIFEDARKIWGEDDPFGIEKEASQLRRLLHSRKNIDMLVSFNSYLERIDSHLTMLQLMQGDPSDILQNVRWQRDVLLLSNQEKSPAQKDIPELCENFISAWDAHKAGVRNYPALLERLIPLLQRLARELGDQEMEKRVNDLQGGYRDLETLQRLHRQVLLQLQSHVYP